MLHDLSKCLYDPRKGSSIITANMMAHRETGHIRYVCIYRLGLGFAWAGQASWLRVLNVELGVLGWSAV